MVYLMLAFTAVFFGTGMFFNMVLVGVAFLAESPYAAVLAYTAIYTGPQLFLALFLVILALQCNAQFDWDSYIPESTALMPTTQTSTVAAETSLSMLKNFMIFIKLYVYFVI